MYMAGRETPAVYLKHSKRKRQKPGNKNCQFYTHKDVDRNAENNKRENRLLYFE
jgi:hypothetical protein